MIDALHSRPRATCSPSIMRIANRSTYSLRTILMLLPLAAALPAILFGLFVLHRVWQQGIADSENDLNYWLQSQTQALERGLDGYQRELRSVSDSLLTGNRALDEFQVTATRIVIYNRAWANIALLDSQGRVRRQTQSDGAPIPAETIDHVMEALKSWRAIHSDALHDSGSDRLTVAVTIPVFDERGALGVIHGELNAMALSNLLPNNATARRFVTVVDRQYRVIARSHDASRYLGKRIGETRAETLRASPDAGVSRSDINLAGERNLVTWKRISNGWTVIVGEDVETYEGPLIRSLTILILLALALLVVGVVSSRITSRYLQSQFATLKGDAMRLSAGGVPHAQDSRILELRELGQALREAAVRLTEAQSGRERAMQALQQADQRKDEFLSILAHELRNPMAPLRNAIALLQERTRDDLTSQQILAMAERQMSQLIRLVDDLLDMARINHGRLELRFESLVLQELVHDAVDTMRPRLDQHDQTLVMQMPPEPIVLQADRVRLIQVLENLISNASKYSADGDAIDLAVRIGPSFAQVTIVDRGIGLAPEELAEVFEIYHQSERSLSRSEGGLGIGLALVRRLVSLHGGTVTAYSDGPDYGSCFEVLLPINPTA